MIKRLTELLYEAEGQTNNDMTPIATIAQYLLDHGVTVQMPKPTKEQIEKETIEHMARVIAATEKIAQDNVGALPSPTMYAKDLYWHGYRKIPDNIGEFSDGYHTFNELYHHRAVLFSVICNLFPELAWKSKLHDTGDMYDGMFIVGIETEYGQATYHFDIDPYWSIFSIKELERAPKWDGHTPADAIERIDNMHFNGYRKIVRCKDCRYWQDNNGGYPHEECRWGKDETPDAYDYCSYGERKEQP